MRSPRLRAFGVAVALTLSVVPLIATGPPATAVPNPVATNDAAYAAFGRVFPDPQGCEAFGAPDMNDDGVKDTPHGVSPWAKGRVCTAQFLSYEEVISGSRYLQQRYPRFLEVIRLDREYDNPEYMSAGLPKTVAIEDGEPKVFGRERRPLYLFKVTDAQSPIPEEDRHHFVYSLSIHGIERAGLEGGIRAMEDLVTWAACEHEANPLPVSPCAIEGPFPKGIVETPTNKPVPTAGQVLERSVVYFMTPNPDGWARGQFAPVELEDEEIPLPNANYTPNVGFQRYNGNGVDLNRDWPTVGYTYRPYSPGSEPETRAYSDVLRGIAEDTTPGHFTGGIDLHGQLTANAFSYTLLGAGQRDFRKNFSTVDQSLRAWADQTQRLAWSPYIVNNASHPGPDHTGVFPAADQWGTVMDTIDYQITGGVGDWFESPIGLGAVGIDNEMSLSHLVPNTVFDPINEQMHVDGNKGLIYSQLASMLTENDSNSVFDPSGKVGYVFNPVRVEHPGSSRPRNPGLPAQDDIDAFVPCAGPACDGGTFAMSGTAPTLEFDVKGPSDGVWNGGISVEATFPNVNGMSPNGSIPTMQLQTLIEGQWQNVGSASFIQGGQPDPYVQAGQTVSANDPAPGRWRLRFTNAVGAPTRVKIDFDPIEAEESPGQAPFSASSMDFFTDLNRYIADPAERFERVTISEVIEDPASLDRFDSLVVVNKLGARSFVTGALGRTAVEANAYFAALGRFADDGGNLVLTDEGLRGLVDLGIATASQIGSNQPVFGSRQGPAPRYQFNVGDRNVCTPTTTDPLAKDVCLPGTAGGSLRQAVEPVPLGYAPDGSLDPDTSVRLRQWFVTRSAWQAACGKQVVAQCTSGILNGQTGLGERHRGDGRIRIAGAMFPDPLYSPGGSHDMRFGVASYALTFSAWQMFLNLVDYERPEVDLAVSISDQPDPVTVGRELSYTLNVTNTGVAKATRVRLTQELPANATFVSASEGCSHDGGVVVSCAIGDVTSGALSQVNVVVVADQPGTLTTTAEVSGLKDDADLGNNVDTETTQAVCTITGTAGSNTLQGTAGDDVICGLGGDDTIRGLDGNDLVLGGDGADRVFGGAGNDDLRGEAGNDDLKGAEGDDRLSGGPGVDALNGGDGTDACDVGEDGGTAVACE